MRHPVQYGAVVVGAVNALVVLSTFRSGAPLLATWVVAIAAAAVIPVFVGMVLELKGKPLKVGGLSGLWRVIRSTFPLWGIALAALAFYGGWIIALFSLATDAEGNLKAENGRYTTTHRRVVTELSEQQYYAAIAANQRIASAVAMAMAGSTVIFVGVGTAVRD